MRATKSMRPHRCGDGRLNTAGHPADPDFEECDDGNDVNDDGCTTSCRYQVRKLIALNYTTCALLGNGRVYCRGYNADRTLGLGEAARKRYVDGWRTPRARTRRRRSRWRQRLGLRRPSVGRAQLLG